MATEPRTTPRQRARVALIAEIKQSALTQLETTGAQNLSLRAITRELGMVSSAIYRYFASRDELITALIVDAYTDLAEVLEQAPRPDGSPREQWRVVCAELRAFARDQPHRFSLVYGTPISDYQAPAETIAPAARVARALASPARAANGSGGEGADLRELAEPLHGQARAMAEAVGEELESATIARIAGAMSQLLGLLTLELGGHFVGTFEPADALYEHTVEHLGDQLGLAEAETSLNASSGSSRLA